MSPSFRIALLTAVATSVLAQGPLTPPPGAPAPTMKTLDQLDAKLEKRTPISSAPVTISTSGSYYLTGNLAVEAGDAIAITADNVTVDLNGATISSTASTGSGHAVFINGVRRNVTIKNGNIRGATTYSAPTFTTGGFLGGVSSNSASSANLCIADLNIFGMGEHGINLITTDVPTLVVERCKVTVCATLGIKAGVIRDCAADTTGNVAITGEVVTNCFGETVNTDEAGAQGIASSSIVENCRGIALSGPGVQGLTVNNSRGTSLSGTGLLATIATNCVGSSTSGTGLQAGNAANCFGTTSSGSAGILANPGTASFCRGNRTAGGIAINAGIAIGCTVASGTVNSLNKFLGTP